MFVGMKIPDNLSVLQFVLPAISRQMIHMENATTMMIGN